MNKNLLKVMFTRNGIYLLISLLGNIPILTWNTLYNTGT